MTRFQALLAATALTLTAAPTLARDKKDAAPAAPTVKLSKDVQTRVIDAQKLIAANDNAGALAKIKEADALPNKTGADDNYVINQLKYNVALKLQDNALLEEAAQGIYDSGHANPGDQAKLTRMIGGLAYNRNDIPKALKYFEIASKDAPTDGELANNVSALYLRQKQYEPAYMAMSRSVDAIKAAGQPVPEESYQRLFAIAYDGKLAARLPQASTALIAAYPTPKNWRNVLLLVRDGNKFDDDANLDLFRLMRVTGALAGERDYVEFSDTLSRRGLPGEAKSVLDEGVAKGAIDPNKSLTKELRASFSPARIAADRAGIASTEREGRSAPTGRAAMSAGDVNLAYDQFAPAAAAYRLALQKGGVDTDCANTRLGIALARSGDKAGALAAFGAVTGPRAAIANYWVIWLNRAA